MVTKAVEKLLDNKCKLCKRTDILHYDEEYMLGKLECKDIARETGLPLGEVARHYELEEHHMVRNSMEVLRPTGEALVGEGFSMRSNLLVMQNLFNVFSTSANPQVYVAQIIALNKEMRQTLFDVMKFEKMHGGDDVKMRTLAEGMIEDMMSYFIQTLPLDKLADFQEFLEAKGMAIPI